MSSSFPSAPSAVVKSFQEGYFDNVAPTFSSGEDNWYYDVTLSTAVDPEKCMIMFEGGFARDTYDAYHNAVAVGGTTIYVHKLFARLTSSTNLRFSADRNSSGSGTQHMMAQWKVIEFY